MKFLLLVHNNLEALEGLTEDQLTELAGGREQVATLARELLKSGELVSVLALNEPAETKDVQLVAGTPVISDRPLLETKEFLAGALVVNCASQERALELAAMPTSGPSPVLPAMIASATISVPMPSPGRTAIFMIEEDC